ncbi:hypothetical protein AHOG_26970 [Actinoalloteichus hoggarensis]|uniref:PPE family protein n=1 Tax=Actinoalloteichus hoggarensis TaxID=1470176 RepID=A0A221WAJ3_9PSEU|nr:hypothetical protein AHOG_26970 [Actinoalloteichus hoggarensis]
MADLILSTTSASFEGRTARDLKSAVSGAGHGGSFHDSYAQWSNVAITFGDIGDYIDSALSKAAGAHSGAASDASQGAVAPLAEYARQGQAQAEAIRDVMSLQNLEYTTARLDTPDGQESPPPKEGFEWVLPSQWTGHGDRMDAYEAENQAARDAMYAYQNETNARLSSVPLFEEPPEVMYSAKGSTPTDVSPDGGSVITTPPTGGGPGSGGWGGLPGGSGDGGPPSPGGGSGLTPPGGGISPPGGGGGHGVTPPGGHGVTPPGGAAPGISPDHHTPSPTPVGPGPGAQVPPGHVGPTPPGGGYGQPGPGGFLPGGPPSPGGPGGQAGGPGGGRLPGGVGGPGGARVPGGIGGGFGGGPGGGRLPGGFGPGGAGGFGPGGPGAGGFGPGGPGAGGMTGAGGPGARLPGGFGPAGGGFGPGGGGAAGGGMAGGGAGGRGGPGEEDKEHKRADYLLETEDVFGDGIKVAPAVFGENPPGYGG